MCVPFVDWAIIIYFVSTLQSFLSILILIQYLAREFCIHFQTILASFSADDKCVIMAKISSLIFKGISKFTQHVDVNGTGVGAVLLHLIIMFC